jgi:hypothetical protein
MSSLSSLSAPLGPLRASKRQAQRRNEATTKPKRTTRISRSQGRWIIGGTKSEERKLLERIVEYLHVDPLRDGDPIVLRFLLKEWKLVQPTLHTIGTMEGLKQKLLDMKVPYLRRASVPVSQSARPKWEYWNDYTQDGIGKFYEENSQEPVHQGNLQETVDQNATEEASETTEAGDISQEDDDSYQNPIQLVEESPEMRPQSQPLIDTEAHQQKDQSVSRPSRSTTPASIQEEDTVKKPSDEEKVHAAHQVAYTRITDMEGNTVIDLQEMEQRNQRRRKESAAMGKLTQQLLGGQSDSNMTPSSMLQTFEGILTERIQDASNILDTRQSVWKQNIIQLQSQVKDQESALQERLRRHEHRVLKAETSLSEWEKMLLDQEERLEAKEKEMLTRLQAHETAYIKRLGALDATLEERQSERILADGLEWEDHIETKFDEFMQVKLQQTHDEACERFEQRLEEMANQREKRTKAWMEVAATQTLDHLSTSLKTFHAERKAEIDEFFEVSKMNLQQDLDEFQYHAQETLHAGIFGEDHPNPRARHAAPPSRAIAVESEEEETPAHESMHHHQEPPQGFQPAEGAAPSPATAPAVTHNVTHVGKMLTWQPSPLLPKAGRPVRLRITLSSTQWMEDYHRSEPGQLSRQIWGDATTGPAALCSIPRRPRRTSHVMGISHRINGQKRQKTILPDSAKRRHQCNSEDSNAKQWLLGTTHLLIF